MNLSATVLWERNALAAEAAKSNGIRIRRRVNSISFKNIKIKTYKLVQFRANFLLKQEYRFPNTFYQLSYNISKDSCFQCMVVSISNSFVIIKISNFLRRPNLTLTKKYYFEQSTFLSSFQINQSKAKCCSNVIWFSKKNICVLSLI